MVPMLGREVVEGQQGLGILVKQAAPRWYLAAYFSLKTSTAASAAARVSAWEISRKSAVTVGSIAFGK